MVRSVGDMVAEAKATITNLGVADVADALDAGDVTLLYCASGGRSALAVKSLRELGYTDVAHLDSGFRAWLEQGRPVTRHP